MKFLTALFVLVGVCYVSAAVTQEQRDKLLGYHKECAALTGVNSELVQQAREGHFTDDDKLKNHIFCVSKKAGFQNEAGDIQLDVLKQKVSAALDDADLTDQLISKCAIARGSGPETAYQTIKCYKENNPNHVSIV